MCLVFFSKPFPIQNALRFGNTSASRSWKLADPNNVKCVLIPMIANDGGIRVFCRTTRLAPHASVGVLLVGKKDEDFYLIREILAANAQAARGGPGPCSLPRRSQGDVEQKTYGLVMFEHKTGDAEAVHFVAEFLHAGVSVPFILLTEDADENTVAEIIHGGIWNCVTKSQLDGATLVRTIRNTLAVHSLQQEQQSAEHSLRKLSRAVEQSADIDHDHRPSRNH